LTTDSKEYATCLASILHILSILASSIFSPDALMTRTTQNSTNFKNKETMSKTKRPYEEVWSRPK
jgi:hypothetical protein